MKYSIIFPCKDEESTIAICISKAKKVLPNAEIIVVDNNSKDKSSNIAKRLGANVIIEKRDGYGAALLKGFNVAKGKYIIMCDADNTYDLLELSNLIKYTDTDKYDMIIGNRLNKKMKNGSMPFLHRYIGNPLLSALMRYMFHNQITDTHSGLRIIKKSSLEKLQLQSAGMEIASEMIIKASKMNMKIKEVDISYGPRIGESKLKSFNDGWKHLKMMLLYSPNHLFLIPGLFLFALGMMILIIMYSGPVTIYGWRLETHPAIVGSFLAILGYQIIMLWLYAKTYAVNILEERNRIIDWIDKNVNLEKSIIIGICLFFVGAIIGIFIVHEWISSSFGQLFELRRAIFAMTLLILGMETIFSGFMLSILGTKSHVDVK